MIRSFFLFLIFSNFALSAMAAGELPPELKAMWPKFQAALAADNKDEVAGYIAFPLKTNEFGTVKNSAALKASYPRIFRASVKKQILQQTPERKNKSYTVWADGDQSGPPLEFIFTKVGNRYLLTLIDNPNE